MAAKKLTFHYLSERDILKTGLTLSESIELCTYAFKEHGEKLVENPPKIAIHPLPDAFLHAMSGRSYIILTFWTLTNHVKMFHYSDNKLLIDIKTG